MRYAHNYHYQLVLACLLSFYIRQVDCARYKEAINPTFIYLSVGLLAGLHKIASG